MECFTCGRIWVDSAPAQDEHVGGCVVGESATWTSRCAAHPRIVKPWPELVAAYLLGGPAAAEACTRSVQARAYGRHP